MREMCESSAPRKCRKKLSKSISASSSTCTSTSSGEVPPLQSMDVDTSPITTTQATPTVPQDGTTASDVDVTHLESPLNDDGCDLPIDVDTSAVIGTPLHSSVGSTVPGDVTPAQRPKCNKCAEHSKKRKALKRQHTRLKKNCKRLQI